MTATSLRARAVLGVGQLHRAADTTDLGGVGAGAEQSTVDDGVACGGVGNLHSLGLAPLVPCEESKQHPAGVCKAPAMPFVNIISLL